MSSLVDPGYFIIHSTTQSLRLPVVFFFSFSFLLIPKPPQKLALFRIQSWVSCSKSGSWNVILVSLILRYIPIENIFRIPAQWVLLSTFLSKLGSSFIRSKFMFYQNCTKCNFICKIPASLAKWGKSSDCHCTWAIEEKAPCIPCTEE